VSEFVPVLQTRERPRMEAACSLLRHDGIPYQLREMRALAGYLPFDELELRVPSERASEAADLLALLDQEAHSLCAPYRSHPLDHLDELEHDPAAPAAAEPAVDAHRQTRVRAAIVLTGICALAIGVVTIGLAFAYHEILAGPTPRMTPRATSYAGSPIR
jgi:hypothetical protein